VIGHDPEQAVGDRGISGEGESGMSIRTDNIAMRLGLFLVLLVAAALHAWSPALAADLPLRPPQRPAAAANDNPIRTISEYLARATSNPIKAAGANGPHTAVASPPTLTASDRALAAREQFNQARVAMERAMLLREANPAASIAALDTAMKDLSVHLATIERMPGAQPSETAKIAKGLVQAWYGDGMKIIKPPEEGLLEMPLPMNVRTKAKAVASALDRLVDEVGTSSIPAIASAKGRVSGVAQIH
jgi:hypothetical protein